MGFLDTLGSLATTALTLFAPAPAAALGGAAIAAITGTPAQPTAVQQITALPAATAAVIGGAAATQLTVAQATGGAVMPSGVGGAALVFTQTVIQRVSRQTGLVLTQQVKKGSPWLMRSEVRALTRVTKAIRLADSKITRKQGKVSNEALQKAVLADVQQLAIIQSLTNGHHGVKC